LHQFTYVDHEDISLAVTEFMVNPFTTLFRQLCTPLLPATHMTIEIPQMKEVAFQQYKRQLYKYALNYPNIGG